MRFVSVISTRIYGRLVQRFYHTKKGVFGCLPARNKNFYETELRNTLDEDGRLLNLVNAYRRYGYRKANLDPLQISSSHRVPELSPTVYNLDLNEEILYENNDIYVSDLVTHLEQLYCGPIAVEFMHLLDCEERKWFGSAFEAIHGQDLPKKEKIIYGELMLKSQNFDNFLALKYATVKRYGCEGVESIFAFFRELFEKAASFSVEDLTICMAHRGRLNLLSEILQFPLIQMFRKISGKAEFPNTVHGIGDVLSHLRSTFDYETNFGTLRVSLLPNPSHLEAINPVAVGRTRARSMSKRVGDYGTNGRSGDGVLCVQVHGDGAFTGQGVSWETVSLSQVPHFTVGGSIHLVVNNQIAYTAEAETGRSSAHCTDIAKAIDSPVIHVNGDFPELLAKATNMALNYRDRYRKDIFINLIAYRRWGHNELDDPHFTQPLMYRVIDTRKSIPDKYADKLLEDGLFSQEEKEEIIKKHTEHLTNTFKAVEGSMPEEQHWDSNWSSMVQAPNKVEVWDTGIDIELLKFIGAQSVAVPKDFKVNEHLKKMFVEARLTKMKTGENIDWATAEALAFGSVLLQGYDIRLSGQDVGRGTFSQRHAMLVDQQTDEAFIPLNNIIENQKHFIEVANNLLSEEAILGYEFGFSIENPKRLCIWEAQFGDFFNGAQIMIDTFITSAESKWLTQSGLTLVLPHGFDGAGPEHSTCRMERFLQLCDSREDQIPPDGQSVNFYVANPTTSAQYFHLLRRQVIPPYRKPLVVVGPKILLRHPMAASKLSEMAEGSSFRTVIANDSTKPDAVKKIVFVSGKHCYTIQKALDERKITDTVIVRLESICPFPLAEIRSTIATYPRATKFVWSQEEPRNAGAWNFVRSRFANSLGIILAYCGRMEMAWTATAIGCIHDEEHRKVIEDTLAA